MNYYDECINYLNEVISFERLKTGKTMQLKIAMMLVNQVSRNDLILSNYLKIISLIESLEGK
jgi:hypothetical protein